MSLALDGRAYVVTPDEGAGMGFASRRYLSVSNRRLIELRFRLVPSADFGARDHA